MKLTRAALLFASGLLAGCFFVSKDPPPSDAVVLKAFSDHQPVFEELAQFCIRYPRVDRVAETFTIPGDLDSVGVSRDALIRVRTLMRQVGCPSGMTRTYGFGGPRFSFFAEGLPSGGVEKGIAYLEQPPSELFASLDDLGWETTAHTRRFRAIEGRWYLYFERD